MGKPLDERLEFLPELDDACQYSTVYWDGKPVATLQRRRVLERFGPSWTLYDTNGGLLHKFYTPTSYDGLKFRTYTILRNCKYHIEGKVV